MNYFNKKYVSEAVSKDEELGGYIITLYKFGVCGVINYDVDKICNFLTERSIKFDKNSRGIIWSEKLPLSLKQIFRKKWKK